MRKNDAILALFVAGLSLILYLNALPGAFHYDDFHHIVENRSIRDLGGYKAWFTDPGSFSSTGAPMYRPLTLLSFALNYRFGGYDPAGYVMVNILLHALCALLVFMLLRRLGVPGGLAVGGALIFALHPLQTETVNYISSRASLLCGVFHLLSLLSAHTFWQKESFGLSWLVLSCFFFCLALLSKSLGITLPFALLLLFFFSAAKEGWWPPRRVWFIFSVLLLFGILYLGFRCLIGQWTFVSPDPPRGVWVNLLTQARAIVFYLRLTFFPVHLSVDHAFSESRSFFEFGAAASILLLLLFLAAALRFWKRLAGFGFFYLWFILTLLPTSSVIPLNHIVSEHRLYLPLIGFALGASDIWVSLDADLSLWGRRLARTAIILIIVCYSVLTVERNNEWQSELCLWRDALRKSPKSDTTLINLGNAERQHGNLKRAWWYFARVLEFHPSDFEARANLAALMLDRQMYEEALKFFEALLVQRPDNAELHYNAALAYLGTERYRLGGFHLGRALELRPGYTRACIDLGLLYAGKLNQPGKARSTLLRCLQIDPGEAERAEIEKALSGLSGN